MKKIIFWISVFIAISQIGFAQLASYYPALRLPVAQKAVYELPYETLQKYWSFVIENQYIHLYRQGKEVAIDIHSKNSSYLLQRDYLLFMGFPNDGLVDSALYQSPEAQPNFEYSLFSDTASYILTYEPHRSSSLRITQELVTDTEIYVPTQIGTQSITRVFSDLYFPGLVLTPFENEQIWDSFYQSAEGWMSKRYSNQLPATFSLDTTQIAGDTIKICLRLASQLATSQVIGIWQGNVLLANIELKPAECKNWEGEVLLSKGTEIILRGENSQFGIAFLKYAYLQNIHALENTSYLWKTANAKSLYLPKVQVWNISDRNIPLKAVSNHDSVRTKAKEIFVWDKPKTMTNISSLDEWKVDSAANFLIVTNKDLWASAQLYAAYRQTQAGGGFRCQVVSSQMIYDLYNFGDKSTLAFQRYFATYSNLPQPVYVLLIGTGTYPQNARKNPLTFARDVVPTFGYPCSDTPFAINKNISIGRIPAETNAEVEAYLRKVIVFEKDDNTYEGRKQILHLSGGRYGIEQTLFRVYLDSLAQIALSQNLEVQTIGKKTDAYVETRNVAEEVNHGLAMITLLGHSAIGQLDLDIGYASNPDLGYQNQAKYPFVLVNGCDAGDFFTEKKALSTDWILSANRGAIAFLAHTHLAYPNSLYDFSTSFYQEFFQNELAQSLGEVQKTLLENPTVEPYLKTTLQQFTLQGDPSIKIFKAIAQPDIAFLENSLTLESRSDSVRIGVKILNFGKIADLPFSVHLYINHKEVFQTMYTKKLIGLDSLSLIVPFDANWESDTLHLKMVLDEENSLTEANRTNNEIVLHSLQLKKDLQWYYPQNWAIVSKPEIWLEGSKNSDKVFTLQVASNKTFSSIIYQQQHVEKGIFRYLFKSSAKDTTTYYWRVMSGEKLLQKGTFTFIPDSPLGWIQRTDEHFQSVQSSGIKWENEAWKIQSDTLKISLFVPGADIPQSNYLGWVKVNQQQWLGNGLCYPWSSLNALTFDEQLRPFHILPQLSCGNSPYWVQNLNENLLLGENPLLTFLQKLNDGEWLLLWSHGRVDTKQWTAEIWSKLQELGFSVSQLKALPLGTPFLLVVQKGRNKVFEKLGNGSTSTINHTITLFPEKTDWRINPPNLGALGYVENVFVDISPLETSAKYEIWLNESPYPLSEKFSLKYPFSSNIVTSANISFIAKQVQEASQLHYWGVHSTPLPDLVLQAIPEQQVVEIGQAAKIKLAAFNLSDAPFVDSTILQWQVLKNREILQTNTQALSPIMPHDSIVLPELSLIFEQAGEYILRFWINPLRKSEANFLNNLSQFIIKVKEDTIPPLMWVRVNSKIAQKFEHFPPNPALDIQVIDNNPFSSLKKENIEIFSKLCSTCPWSETDKADISLISASGGKILLHFQPKNWLRDTVWIRVRSWDRAAEKSKISTYQIPIVLNDKSNPVAIDVFPNPLTTWSKIRLSNLLNTDYKAIFQIFNHSGQKLFEIQKDVNSVETEFFWDGRNQEGYILPNAMYFYKLTLQNKDSKDSLSIQDTFSGKIILDRR